jgi:type III secretion system low calcium response chaperone LcrH/SycD
MEISEQERQKIEELTLACLVDGTPLSATKDFSDEEIEAVYNVAYNFYQQRQYDKAEKLFAFLTLYEHTDSRFSLGLGGCYQSMGKHNQAVNAYTCAALADATNPMPAFHACECYMALEDWDNARKAITAVETLCEIVADEADHGELLKKVEVMSETIDSKAAAT